MRVAESWLGRIPNHWQVRRLGALGTLAKGSGGSKEDNRDEGVAVVRYGELYTRFDHVITRPQSFISADATARYTSLKPGTIVFAASGEDRADIGKSALSLLEEPAYVGGDTVLFRSETDDVDPFYLSYVLESRPLKALKAIRSTGFTVVHITAGKLKTLPIPLPKFAEQRAIASYLDHETARIDDLIAEQQRLIEILHERRAAVIAAEVADMVPRQGDRRLKHYIMKVRQGWSPQCNAWPADGVTRWAVLKAGAANGGVFRPDENKELPEWEQPRSELVVRRGQLIVSRANTRELVGSAAVVEDDYPKLMLCDKLYALDLNPLSADAHLVVLLLGTRVWRDLIEIEASGSSHSMQNISQADILNLPMALPPLDLQRGIVSRLDEQTSKIDILITEAERFIDLARERRSALITAAVTGQIDVRATASVK